MFLLRSDFAVGCLYAASGLADVKGVETRADSAFGKERITVENIAFIIHEGKLYAGCITACHITATGGREGSANLFEEKLQQQAMYHKERNR